MKKSWIIYIAIFSSLSLIGLVTIQINLINSAIQLREKQFKDNIRISLFNISKELEKIETLNAIARRKKGKKLLKQLDSIAIARGGRFYWSSKSMYSENDSGNKYVYTNIDDTDSTQIKASYNKDNKSKNNTLIENIIEAFIDINSFKPPYKRVKKEQLKRIIEKNLAKKGIYAKFEYAITDDFNVIYLLSNKNYAKEIVKSRLFVRLYPNDFLSAPYYLKLYFPNPEKYIIKSMGTMLITSATFIVIIIAAFTFTIYSLFKQKKLSEIRSDFVNNMTHELKTPISTIKLATEAIKDPDINKKAELVNKYINIIKDENERLNNVVNRVLLNAKLQKGKIQLEKQEINIHNLILKTTENIALQLSGRNGKLHFNLNAVNPIISGDLIHIENVLYNLLDNALKYTGENPEITVGTKNINNKIQIFVKDNGIGISKKEQKKIFEPLYRVATGNIHNVKGFGLGLNYVKQIVEKHNGSIFVESMPGKGSIFYIEFNVKNNKNGEN